MIGPLPVNQFPITCCSSIDSGTLFLFLIGPGFAASPGFTASPGFAMFASSPDDAIYSCLVGSSCVVCCYSWSASAVLLLSRPIHVSICGYVNKGLSEYMMRGITSKLWPMKRSGRLTFLAVLLYVSWVWIVHEWIANFQAWVWAYPSCAFVTTAWFVRSWLIKGKAVNFSDSCQSFGDS